MPEMFSFNNERKYQTLIPLMKTSHLIDDDLKDKLNKCAFDFSPENKRTERVTGLFQD